MSQSINAAAPHASVQSNVVLSASIVGEKVNNLKDSVSMIFQLPKVKLEAINFMFLYLGFIVNLKTENYVSYVYWCLIVDS